MRSPTPSPPPYDGILTGHERRDRLGSWRPDGVADWLLIHTLAGHAEVDLSSGRFVVGPGQAILYRPRAPQRYAAIDTWELVWAHVLPPPHWLELLKWPELAPGVMHMPAPGPPLLARIEKHFIDADRLAASGLPQSTRLAQNALEAALLWWDAHNPLRRRLDPRVVEAIAFLSHNLGRRVPIEELAAAVHLSPSRLAHLFRGEVGVAPAQYGELQRLERSKQLLTLTTMPVYEVARQCGFGNQFHFATRFRKLTGRTPTAFRAAA
jgi:AraC family transcriptional regulator, arabinose operon regulatory protein